MTPNATPTPFFSLHLQRVLHRAGAFAISFLIVLEYLGGWMGGSSSLAMGWKWPKGITG